MVTLKWPEDQAETCEYILSTLPVDTPIAEMISATYQRWRIGISFDPRNRRQTLSIRNKSEGYLPGIVPIGSRKPKPSQARQQPAGGAAAHP